MNDIKKTVELSGCCSQKYFSKKIFKKQSDTIKNILMHVKQIEEKNHVRGFLALAIWCFTSEGKNPDLPKIEISDFWIPKFENQHLL